MQIIPATTLRNNFSTSLGSVTKGKKSLLVAKRGKIVSALVDIELFEDLLSLTDKKYLKSIKKARQEYEEGNVFSHDEVFGDL
ncbi:MAG: type II toxin-antitoxin system Phd/YefM family antitoxin [Patescibacteria group bacterium]